MNEVVVFAAVLAILAVFAITLYFATRREGRGLPVGAVERFDFTQAPVCNDTYYFEIDGFLSHKQCDALVAATEAEGLDISQVIGADANVTDESVRKSKQHWYKPEANDVTRAIRQQTIDVVNKLGCIPDPAANVYEDIQVVKYDVGGKYDPHYDDDECGPDMGVACKNDRRVATLLIYLNDDMKGGTTRFPKLNVEVVPKKGKALFFWVSDPKSTLLYDNTLHGGMAVEKGHKWIATQWVRRALGA